MGCCPTVFILCDSFFLSIMIIHHRIAQYITKSLRFIYIHTPRFHPHFFLSTIMDSLSNNHDLPSLSYKIEMYERNHIKRHSIFPLPSPFFFFLLFVPLFLNGNPFFFFGYLHVTQYTFFFLLVL